MLVLCLFLGGVMPGIPMLIVSLGLGWATALVLGVTYECVVAAKAERGGTTLRPALSAAAKKGQRVS
jgi:hypothetical protein